MGEPKRGNGEGSIYQDARGLWRASVSLESGKRKYLSGRTRQDVAKKLASAIRDVDHGLPLMGGQLTVGKYLNDWLEQAARPKLKASTYRSYEELVRLHIAPALGRHPLIKLTPQHVQKFQNDKQAAGHPPRRVQMMRDVLRAALNRAVKWQLVGRNVVLLVDSPRVPVANIQPFSPEDATKLLEAAGGHRYEHLYALLLTTGLRLGEALALQWKADVDIEHARTVTVRRTLEWLPGHPWRLTEPKAASALRTVPLITPSIAALKAQRTRQLADRLRAPAWSDYDLVFTNELGDPLRQTGIQKAFKDVLAFAGLPTSHRPHDLRHSMATYLMGAGVPPRVVMEILGHSTLAMTQRYSHVLGPMITDAADRLEALWARAPGQK